MFVGEPSPDETLEILWGLRSKYESFHDLKILDEALNAAIELSTRYLINRRLPDKAIDLIDQACSHKKLRHHYGLDDLRGLTGEEKKYLFTKYQHLPSSSKTILIGTEDVARVVSEWTGIPAGKLTEQEALTFLVNAGYDPAMGARPLRRAIEVLVVEPLADNLIRGKISEHDAIKLGRNFKWISPWV